MADDAMYALVLLASLAAGAVLYSGMVPIQARAAFSAGIGVLVLCLCCQTQAIHAFFPAAMVLLVIMLLPKYLHGKLCLSISIGYLALARNLQLGAFTNAVLLILTLKLMSIGFDSQDGKLSSRSPILILQYLFCFNGMLTGPFYRFTAWEEVLVLPRTGHVRKSPPGAVARALARTIAAVAIWRGVAVFLPFSAVYDPSFGKATLLYRCVYAYLSCFQFRYRFYACWLLMEAVGLLVGHEDASNVQVLQCELAIVPSQYVNAWNTSVQRFLVDYVYRRVPACQRAARQLCTFLFSAYWHGIHAGYYLFFGGIAAMIAMEQLVGAPAARRVRTLGWAPAGGMRAFICNVACSAWTMCCFTWFGQAFHLKHTRDIQDMWERFHYVGFAVYLAPIPVALAIVAASSRMGSSPNTHVGVAPPKVASKAN
uniref:Lysophospholipid acyltransferase 7 n=2 Tax=Chrysotila carterae TaxID=13221 RepID=A0A7S4B407_CHRCT